ncbi:MAG: hypothetical protein K6B67_09700 [Lachnospiraceae bacterium]|nr:hypothetical protein [Lachnospiraceae bacterium]
MTFLIGLRTRIRKIIMKNETWFVKGSRFIFALVALLMLSINFGYQKTLSHWWVSVVIAAICMFIPAQGASVVISFVGVIQLMALSTDLGVAAIIIMILVYALTSYFKSAYQFNNIAIAGLNQLRIPFCAPLAAGLLGNFNELAGVVGGSIVAFYLKEVKENAASFLDETSDITAADLIQTRMISNTMFYIFLAAMIIGFMVVYFVRTKEIKYAWVQGTGLGVVTQFVILLAGYLFVGNKSNIPTLIIGSVISFAVGMLFVFFFKGLDYSRIEKVQYEDDDYFYYVTAVPKIHIAEQEKEIKKITDAKIPGVKDINDEDAE